MAKVRTFIAIDISPEIVSRSMELVRQLDTPGAGVRWNTRDDLHLTLQFLGEVPDEDVTGIFRRIEKVTRRFQPFTVEAIGAGAFPSIAQPRTVWLGVREGAETLIALHDAIQSELEPLGFRVEHRRFRPHITLGRVRGVSEENRELGRRMEQFADFDAGAMEVVEVQLYASELTRQGAIYTSLGAADLGA